MTIRRLATALSLALAVTSPALADDEPAAPITAEAALERLKSLAGTWTGEAYGEPMTITYRPTGGGSAVVETFCPGLPVEMMTVYHLDGDDLRLTHYCAAGNQPRMVLDRDASTAETLVFAFDGGTNFDPSTDMHIHEGRLTITDADHVTGTWLAYVNGEPTAEPAVFAMTRSQD